jgi:hypothetical protein
MDAASGDPVLVALSVVVAVGMAATWCWAVARWWTHRIRDRNADAFERWTSDMIEHRDDEPRSRVRSAARYRKV